MQHFVAVRDYSRLKDMAEASAVAGQVRTYATTARPLLSPSDRAKSWRQAAHVYETAHRLQGEADPMITRRRLLMRLGWPCHAAGHGIP